jgi:hypothetical protein
MSIAREARLLGANPSAVANPRPQRIVNETFDAFRIKPDGEVYADLRGDPEPMCSADTLEQCAADAAIRCVHKAQFAVRHTDCRTGEVVLHIYQVRQKSTPTYLYKDYLTTRVHPLYPEKIASVRIDGLVRS